MIAPLKLRTIATYSLLSITISDKLYDGIGYLHTLLIDNIIFCHNLNENRFRILSIFSCFFHFIEHCHKFRHYERNKQ